MWIADRNIAKLLPFKMKTCHAAFRCVTKKAFLHLETLSFGSSFLVVETRTLHIVVLIYAKINKINKSLFQSMFKISPLLVGPVKLYK